ncbi:MAG: DUF7619 domain-containing protein [Bacteroidota bacterium]
MKIATLLFIFLPLLVFSQFNHPKELELTNPGIITQHSSDIDNDGDKDLVMASVRFIFVYVNDGFGTFDRRDTLLSGLNIWDFQVADLNQDSFPDFVTLGDDEFHVYGNEGGQSFNERFHYSSTMNSTSVVLQLEDLNNDSLPDILVSTYMSGVWTNQGDFNFSNLTNYIDFGSTTQLAVADMDGDGYKDIINTTFDHIHLNFADSLYQYTRHGYLTTDHSDDRIEDVKTQDIGLDGDMDLILLVERQNSFHFVQYINDGTGVLSREEFDEIGSVEAIRDFVVKDINGDLFPDIVYAYSLSVDNSTSIRCLTGMAGGGFASLPGTLIAQQRPNISYYNPYLVIDDLIPGGYPEIAIVTLNQFEQMDIYSAIAPLAYTFRTFDWTRWIGSDFLPVQLDGDSDLELYNPPAVFDPLGDYEYETLSLLPEKWGTLHCLDDLNADGVQDAVVSYSGLGLTWHAGTPNGVFSGTNNISSFVPISVDTISVPGNDSYKLILLYPNEIRAHYGTLSLTNSNEFYSSFVDEQANLNEWDFRYYNTETPVPNLVQWALVANNKQRVYVNASNEIQLLSSDNVNAHDVQIGDWDGDGLDDILYADQNSIRWFKQQADESFTEQEQLVVYPGVLKFKIVDLDEDGDSDLIYADTTLCWMENYGGGAHSNRRNFSLPDHNSIQWLKALDTDLDGDPEVYCSAGIDLPVNGSQPFVFVNDLNTNGSVSGLVYRDMNANGTQDPGEQGFANVMVTSEDDRQAYTDNTGHFTFGYLDSAITASPLLPPNWTVSSDSLSFTLNDEQVLNGAHDLVFGLTPASDIRLAEADVFSQIPRCNTLGNVILTARNTGTLSHDGIMQLKLADSLTFIESDPPADSISNGFYYWHYNDLEVTALFEVIVQVQFPDFRSIGLMQSNRLEINVLDDQMQMDTLIRKLQKFEVVCAYDPNDKQVEPKGFGEEGYIAPDGYFTYTIRFQNTGTDTAFHVRIVDDLSSVLDVPTLEVLASSHPYRMLVMEPQKLVFHFDSILLPDSTTNFIGSQGYVRFRIKHVAGLGIGSEISNQAGIYFDMNPAVITNMVTNTLFSCDSLDTEIKHASTDWCENQAIVFYNESRFIDGYDWIMNGQSISSVDSCVFAPQQAGDTLFLSISNDICVRSNYIIIPALTEFIQPECSVSDTVLMCPGATIPLSSNITANNQWYHNGAPHSQEQNTTAYAFGTYVLEVNNQGCIAADTVVVANGRPQAVIWYEGENDHTNLQGCPFDSLELSVQDTGQFEWFLDGTSIGTVASVTIQDPGLYVMKITQNGCSNWDTLTYIWTFIPVYTLDFEAGVLSADDSEPFAYSWINCVNEQTVAGENSSSFMPEENGSYAAVLESGSCTYQTGCFEVLTVGVEKEGIISFTVYPNPVREKLELKFPENKARRVLLYDSKGSLLLDQSIKGSEAELEFASYAKGFYILHVETAVGWQQIKVIKE